MQASCEVHHGLAATRGTATNYYHFLTDLLPRWGIFREACPDLEDQVKLDELLTLEKIGVNLTEEFQLEPEQSTSAIIVPHPEAKYFIA